jgi:hypothetical protein
LCVKTLLAFLALGKPGSGPFKVSIPEHNLQNRRRLEA